MSPPLVAQPLKASRSGTMSRKTAVILPSTAPYKQAPLKTAHKTQKQAEQSLQ
jgi:hypothetical protein